MQHVPCAEEESTPEGQIPLKTNCNFKGEATTVNDVLCQTRLGRLKGLPRSGCLGSEPNSQGCEPTDSSSP